MARRSNSHNSGLALVVVLAAIALAAIMGYALLASASLQSQMSSNKKSIVDADSVAESGVNLAMYYLQHPESAPALGPDGYWTGGTNIALNGQTQATLERVTVTQNPAGSKFYDIESVGNAGGRLSRTCKARVYVESRYNTKYALAANSDFALPGLQVSTTIKGKIRTDGVISGGSGAVIDDSVEAVAGSLSGTLISTSGSVTVKPRSSYPVTSAPSYSQITLLKDLPNYTYNGQTYTASVIPAATANRTLLANATTNPLNVWYATGDVTLTGTVILDGTLVIAGTTRSLIINGNGIDIRAKPGMPALIVGKDVRFQATGHQLKVEGLAWIGDDVTTASALNTNLTLEVKGALMFGGATPTVASGFKGTFKSEFDASLADVPELSGVGQVPSSVKVISWSN